MLFPSPFNEDHFISFDLSTNVLIGDEFPSTFNEDHFISILYLKVHHCKSGFRPLLTRIISYQLKNAKQLTTVLLFPSPFNEDHFISYATSKCRYIKHPSYFCLPNIGTGQPSDKSILSNFRTFQMLT